MRFAVQADICPDLYLKRGFIKGDNSHKLFGILLHKNNTSEAKINDCKSQKSKKPKKICHQTAAFCG